MNIATLISDFVDILATLAPLLGRDRYTVEEREVYRQSLFKAQRMISDRLAEEQFMDPK